ncbi:MAG: ABC transporter substrate-binding protein, partial [Chloroflexota bacterium]|nr:ABC transporter substrate-binding protein [Chloroflexota bacterium]
FEAIVENNTVDDKLVGMPWYTDAGLLYHRTDLLEKYAVEVPTTWAELQTAAQTIQDGERAANPNFYGFVFQGRSYEGLTCNGLEWQVSNGGGTIVESDGTLSINNPQAIAIFEQAAGWVNTIAPEGVTNYNEPDALNVWVGGNAAFLRNWPYAWAASQDPATSQISGKVGVGPLPMGDGEGARNAATLGGWQLMVSAYSQNQEAAIEYVKYLSSQELQKSFAIERSHLPTIAAVYDDPDVAAASEFIPRLKDVFQGGAVARPSSVTSFLYPEVSAIYYSELNQILTGAKDATTAVADMESQIQPLLEELGI